MLVYLVRHGKTNLNSEHKLSGNSNTAQLNNEGKEHVKKLSKFLEGEKFDAIFCSPLDRVVETAKPIAQNLGKNLKKIDLLREFDFGDLDEKDEQGDAKQALLGRRKDVDFRFPNGESYYDVIKRIDTFLEKVLSENYEKIIVVSHAGTNRALLVRLTNEGKRNLERIDEISVKNTDIFMIDTKTGDFDLVDLESGDKRNSLVYREGL